MFTPSIRIGKKKSDLRDFDCGMIGGSRSAGQRRTARLVGADRQATVTQITILIQL